MQELRFVLIVVGILAIAALLFHGLWSSKKEGKAKFSNKPLGKLDVDQEGTNDVLDTEQNFAPEDDGKVISNARKEPDFGMDSAFDSKFEVDPLLDSVPKVKLRHQEPDYVAQGVSEKDKRESLEPVAPVTNIDECPSVETEETNPSVYDAPKQERTIETVNQASENASQHTSEQEMQVIVLNVHCAGEEPFIGTALFDSMQQNGLIFGEMNIYHRHVDLSGNGKILFSVANMMQPGTLEHDDPAMFETKGISFFMTLPCYGEAEQNFNLMLRTAQQIADDLGGNVLDDQRNLMTPDRLAAYRRQIVEFNAANA